MSKERDLSRLSEASVSISGVTYKYVHPLTHLCWTRTQEALGETGCRFEYLPWVDDAFLPRSRSKAATRFLDAGKYDIHLCFDADVVWKPGSMEALIAACQETRGFVGAAVSNRSFGHGISSAPGENCKLVPGSAELIPAGRLATPFFAVHREALERVADHSNPAANHPYGCLPRCHSSTGEPYLPFFFPFLRNHQIDRRLAEALSEDYAFTVRCLDAGVPVHIDPMPFVLHAGEHLFTLADAFNGR